MKYTTLHCEQVELELNFINGNIKGTDSTVGYKKYWLIAEEGDTLTGDQPVGIGDSFTDALRDYASKVEEEN